MRIPNVVGGSIDLSDLKLVKLDDAEFERLRMQAGDLLLVRTNGNREYVGRCAVFDGDVETEPHTNRNFVYASYLIRARLRLNEYNPYFVQTYLSSGQGRKAMLARAKTSAGQFNINTESLRSILLPAPPRELQDEFAARSARIRSAINAQFKIAEKQETLFSSLQSRAFSGQL